MATDKQINTNRENAKKSTGPKTEAGKNVSRFNAIKHGFYASEIIVQDEERPEFEQLRDQLLEECNPATAIGEELFQRVLHAAWNLHRVRRMESELLNSSERPFSNIYTRAELDAIGRHATRIERAYNRAMKELARHRANNFCRGIYPEEYREMLPIVVDIQQMAQTDVLALRRERLMNAPRPGGDDIPFDEIPPEILAQMPEHMREDLKHMAAELASIPKS